MVRLTVCFVLSIVVLACSGDRPTLMVTTIPAPPPPPFRGVIKEVTDTFNGQTRTYDVTSPADGTLAVRLTWDPAARGALLALAIEDAHFAAGAPDWSPIVGRMEAGAGKAYRVTVTGGGGLGSWNPWDDGYFEPFVLVISLE